MTIRPRPFWKPKPPADKPCAADLWLELRINATRDPVKRAALVAQRRPLMAKAMAEAGGTS